MTEENKQLPPLHFWLARSTYAMVLTAIVTVAAAFNVDILGQFGTSEDSILKAIDSLLPLASAAWLWWERSNPQYRIGL